MNDIAPYLLARHPNPTKTNFAALLTHTLDAFTQGHTLYMHDQSIELTTQLVIDTAAARAGEYAPLVAHKRSLWLYRIWFAEQSLAALLVERLAAPENRSSDTQSFSEGLKPEQQQALKHALTHNLTLINGGPGTGKTFTIARVVRALLDEDADTQIALTAPTGKAAKRMYASLLASMVKEGHDDDLPEAQTLHRLLGISPNRAPLYSAENTLPHDVVIVDEASMLSLELAHALFSALRPSTKLILLGDADQLAAVDPGAVLHDLSCHSAVQNHIITLKSSSRFREDQGIGRLARLIQQGETSATSELNSILNHSHDIIWQQRLSDDIYQRLFAGFAAYIEALQPPCRAADALSAFDEYRILCAEHHGALGTKRINRALRGLHQQALNMPASEQVFHGLALMMTRNDYALQLFNGDIGLCLRDDDGALRIHFPDHEHAFDISRLNLSVMEDAYALSVHKAQGSEFSHVALVGAEQDSRVLSREWLYTGVTRAKSQLSLYMPKDTIKQCLARPIERSTGLGLLLDGYGIR